MQDGAITDEQLKEALAEHARTSERLGAVLVRLNLVDEEKVARAIASQLGYDFVDLTVSPPQPDAVVLIARDVAMKRACIGVRLEAGVLTVAMADPLQLSLVQELEQQTGLRIVQVVASRQDILAALQAARPITAPADAARRPGASSATQDDADAGDAFGAALTEAQADGESPAMIDLANLIVSRAVTVEASDIHIEPTARGVRIRHRLDGVLKLVATLPPWVHEGLIARLKTMSGMNVAEKRLPQEGRIRADASDGRSVDYRASTLRTLHGEKLVLRKVDQRRAAPALDELGIMPAPLEELQQLLAEPHGILLVAGPSASGKSTTLSAMAAWAARTRAGVVTIEDPIEYRIDGVSQTQVNERITLTAASALRSTLQQQPAVVAIDDLRDGAAARLAFDAAQSAQLVIAAIPADRAEQAIAYFEDAGVAPHVIASALIGIVSVRLVRKLCLECREVSAADSEVGIASDGAGGDPAPTFYAAAGCDHCSHTGYRGRLGLFEVITIDAPVRRAIGSGARGADLRAALAASEGATLAADAMARVLTGVTTLEEARRVVADLRAARPLCHECGAVIDEDYAACPRCGARLASTCDTCGRVLQRQWNFCPYCAHGARSSRPRRGIRPDGRSRRGLPRGGKVAQFKKT